MGGVPLFRATRASAYAGPMGQRNARGRIREDGRMTGADGVSVLPAAMVAALVAAGVAISRSVRTSRAVARQAQAGRQAQTVRRAPGPGPVVPSGQVAVKATVDDDGR